MTTKALLSRSTKRGLLDYYGRLVLSVGIASGCVGLAAVVAWPLIATFDPKWRMPAFIMVAVYVGFPVGDLIFHGRTRIKLRHRYPFRMFGAECEIDTLTLPLVLLCFLWPFFK